MTVVELHALALAKVMAAWDAGQGPLPSPHFNPLAGVLAEQRAKDRAAFEARASDGLARVFTIVSCQLADAKDAGRAEEERNTDALRLALEKALGPKDDEFADDADMIAGVAWLRSRVAEADAAADQVQALRDELHEARSVFEAAAIDRYGRAPLISCRLCARDNVTNIAPRNADGSLRGGNAPGQCVPYQHHDVIHAAACPLHVEIDWLAIEREAGAK